MPFFSVIVPTVNREVLVRRALDSVLTQDFDDFEIVVVDSASTDGTRDVVRDYAARDPRVRLITEEVRRGVCPARNTAVDVSTGEWIVPLDSDDELSTGALALFARHIAAAPHVDHHRYMCRWDNGSLSPRPPLVEEEWDYEGYLRFVDRSAQGSSESMSCIRASTFAVVRYPEDRSYETLYHYDFAARFRTAAHPEVARLYHTDAADQNSFVPNPQHWLRVAPDHARSLDALLARHGAAIRRIGPHAYRSHLRTAAKFHFLAGHRLRGIALTLRLWLRAPFTPLSWVIALFGLLGPRPLAWADGIRFRMHMRRR